MITIPLYIILFVYLGFLVCYAGFMFINLFHLFQTGTFTLASFSATLLALGLSAIILWFTWWLLQGTSWQQAPTVWNNAWFGSAFSVEQFFSPFQQ